MRKWKAFIGTLAAALLLLSLLGANAFAEGEGMFRENACFLQDYQSTRNGLNICCSALTEKLPAAADFEVSLGGESVRVADVKSVESEPVTYYCIVDTSGSISATQLLVSRQVLHALCACLSEGDQVVIATLGDELSASGYLTDPARIAERIDAIQTSAANTNLFRAVTDVLRELNTGNKATQRKCVIVLSDGVEDSSAETGRTRQEAETSIAETRIPIYSVVLPGAKTEEGKILGSLSRMSAGGEAYYIGDWSMTEEQIGKAIVTDMKGDYLLRLDLDGFVPQGEELLLLVKYADGQHASFGDSLTVYTKNLILDSPPPTATPTPEPTATPTPEPTATPAPTPEPLPTPDPEPEPFPPYLLWVTIGGAVVLLAVLIAVILAFRKRKAQEEARKQAAKTNPVMVYNPTGPTNWEDTSVPTRTLRFTAVGHSSFTKELRLPEGREVSLGRTREADIVMNESDQKLAGRHCAVLLRGKALRVRDFGSQYGTAVNDIPLQGNTVELHEGDTLTIGSYKYRVQFPR